MSQVTEGKQGRGSRQEPEAVRKAEESQSNPASRLAFLCQSRNCRTDMSTGQSHEGKVLAVTLSVKYLWQQVTFNTNLWTIRRGSVLIKSSWSYMTGTRSHNQKHMWDKIGFRSDDNTPWAFWTALTSHLIQPLSGKIMTVTSSKSSQCHLQMSICNMQDVSKKCRVRSVTMEAPITRFGWLTEQFEFLTSCAVQARTNVLTSLSLSFLIYKVCAYLTLHSFYYK